MKGEQDGYSHKKFIKVYKRKGINLSKMSRDTGVPYMSLYDSLMNESRDRDLRAGEVFKVCVFLTILTVFSILA